MHLLLSILVSVHFNARKHMFEVNIDNSTVIRSICCNANHQHIRMPLMMNIERRLHFNPF